MLGVDTNVLVRFLASDDEAQTPQAVSLFSQPANQPIYLSMLVLAETFTVLTKVRKFKAAQVFDSYRLLLRSDQVQVEHAAIVAQAIDAAEAAGCDFPDALIALQNADAGCIATATFDRRAQRLEQMTAAEEML